VKKPGRRLTRHPPPGFNTNDVDSTRGDKMTIKNDLPVTRRQAFYRARVENKERSNIEIDAMSTNQLMEEIKQRLDRSEGETPELVEAKQALAKFIQTIDRLRDIAPDTASWMAAIPCQDALGYDRYP
jgi:hypothetical protein